MDIRSEIPGQVWKVVAKVGDKLAEEDIIIIIESMKMEIPLISPSSGVLIELHVSEQDIVAEDQLIATLRET